jgi:hypothetical protein
MRAHGRRTTTSVVTLSLCSLLFATHGLAANEPRADSPHATIILPAGTMVVVRMVEAVDATTSRIGDHFSARLEIDLMATGRLIAPRGATVYGKLVEAHRAEHSAGRPELKLELTDILIDDRLQPISTGEYEIVGTSRGANTATKSIGAGATGAVVGPVVGSGAGAAVGAGAVSQVFARGPKVRVPSETVLEFRLRQPLVINRSDEGS